MAKLFSILGRVSIRKETHLACYALDSREMRFVPRRTERSHRVVYADRLKTHTIRCPLDEKHLILLSCRLPSILDAEEYRRLVEDERVRAVEVFGLLLIHAASGEANYMPEAVMYLYYDTILVEVIATTIEKSQFLQEVRLYWKQLQGVSVSWCISNLFESAVVLSPTVVGIRLCLLRLKELLAVEVGNLLVGNPQRFLMQSLLLCLR